MAAVVERLRRDDYGPALEAEVAPPRASVIFLRDAESGRRVRQRPPDAPRSLSGLHHRCLYQGVGIDYVMRAPAGVRGDELEVLLGLGYQLTCVRARRVTAAGGVHGRPRRGGQRRTFPVGRPRFALPALEHAVVPGAVARDAGLSRRTRERAGGRRHICLPARRGNVARGTRYPGVELLARDARGVDAARSQVDFLLDGVHVVVARRTIGREQRR